MLARLDAGLNRFCAVPSGIGLSFWRIFASLISTYNCITTQMINLVIKCHKISQICKQINKRPKISQSCKQGHMDLGQMEK